MLARESHGNTYFRYTLLTMMMMMMILKFNFGIPKKKKMELIRFCVFTVFIFVVFFLVFVYYFSFFFSFFFFFWLSVCFFKLLNSISKYIHLVFKWGKKLIRVCNKANIAASAEDQN